MDRHADRFKTAFTPQFCIGAPSIGYGQNLIENVRFLAARVAHVEILLFHTPTLHNFPTRAELKAVQKLGDNEGLSFSVHLPTSLEIASRYEEKRSASIRMIVDLLNLMDELNPTYHILHIPVTKPTLTVVPGQYLTPKNRDKFDGWTQRATDSLQAIQDRTGGRHHILVENINYSPIFLESFWKSDLCDLCLDMGHLLLGREKVSQTTRQFMPVIKEVHLHGVKNDEEHLSLAVLPDARVSSWIDLLVGADFNGVVNLEVFSPEDLETSLDILLAMNPPPPNPLAPESDNGSPQFEDAHSISVEDTCKRCGQSPQMSKK
jgi:sugar phosphate isomerase/epimerase